MADLKSRRIRPKLVSAWTPSELRAFNISPTTSTLDTFFGIDELPPMASESESPDDPQFMLFPERFGHRWRGLASTGAFLSSLARCRHDADHRGIYGIEEFVYYVFGLQLGYYEREPDTNVHRMHRWRLKLALPMCGKEVLATCKMFMQYRWTPGTPLSDVERPQVILDLVAPRKATEKVPTPNSLPRLVGRALAAFRLLNEVRAESGEAALESWTFLAISFHYTLPTFYKIPITAELADHVARGTYPPAETVVEQLVLDLPNPKRVREGFGPLENREMLVRYCLAFKDLMDAQSRASYEDIDQFT